MGINIQLAVKTTLTNEILAEAARRDWPTFDLTLVGLRGTLGPGEKAWRDWLADGRSDILLLRRISFLVRSGYVREAAAT